MKIHLAVLAGLTTAAALAQQPAARELGDRVEAYLKLRKNAVNHVPKLKEKAEPEEILANKQAQAEAIRTARPRARRGEILTPAVEAYLKQVIRNEMAGESGKPAREAAEEGNPTKEGPVNVPLKVNATYPDDAPLSSVPPSLLLRLPALPEELDFRFVGRYLILHDVNANIIVDFIPNAMPLR